MRIEEQLIVSLRPYLIANGRVEVIMPSKSLHWLPLSALLARAFLRTPKRQLLRDEGPVLHAILLDDLS